MALVELLQEAGMPKGVVNIIHGQHDTVNFICDNPDIKAISFVGEKISAMVLSYEIQTNIVNFFVNPRTSNDGRVEFSLLPGYPYTDDP